MKNNNGYFEQADHGTIKNETNIAEQNTRGEGKRMQMNREQRTSHSEGQAVGEPAIDLGTRTTERVRAMVGYKMRPTVSFTPP